MTQGIEGARDAYTFVGLGRVAKGIKPITDGFALDYFCVVRHCKQIRVVGRRFGSVKYVRSFEVGDRTVQNHT